MVEGAIGGPGFDFQARRQMVPNRLEVRGAQAFSCRLSRSRTPVTFASRGLNAENDSGFGEAPLHERLASEGAILDDAINRVPTAARHAPHALAPGSQADQSSTNGNIEADSGVFVVYFKNSDGLYGASGDHSGFSMLEGDYVPQPMLRHGRRIYAKVHQKCGAASSTDVRLFYISGRDGDSAKKGWWFGVGPGSEVTWAHCRNGGPVPPRSGWKAPSGKLLDQMFVVPQEERASEEIREMEEAACEAVRTAETALEEARTPQPGEKHGSTEALSTVMQQVQDLQRWLMDGQKADTVASVMEGASGGNGGQRAQPSAALVTQLVARLEQLRCTAKEEHDAAVAAAAADEVQAKVGRLVDDDRAYWDQIAKESVQAIERARSLVDDVQAEFEIVVVSGDDDQLESMFSHAQKGIREACTVIKKKYAEAVKLVTLQVRNEACNVLGNHLQELQKTQEMLTDLRCLAAESLVSQEHTRSTPSKSSSSNKPTTAASPVSAPSRPAAKAAAPARRRSDARKPSSDKKPTGTTTIVVDDEDDVLPVGEDGLLKRLASKGLLQRHETHDSVVERAEAALEAPPKSAAAAGLPEGPKKLFLCQKHGLSAVIRFAKGRRRFFCCPLPADQGSCGFQRWMDRAKGPRGQRGDGLQPHGNSSAQGGGAPSGGSAPSRPPHARRRGRSASAERRSQSAGRVRRRSESARPGRSRWRRNIKGRSESAPRPQSDGGHRRYRDTERGSAHSSSRPILQADARTYTNAKGKAGHRKSEGGIHADSARRRI